MTRAIALCAQYNSSEIFRIRTLRIIIFTARLSEHACSFEQSFSFTYFSISSIIRASLSHEPSGIDSLSLLWERVSTSSSCKGDYCLRYFKMERFLKFFFHLWIKINKTYRWRRCKWSRVRWWGQSGFALKISNFFLNLTFNVLILLIIDF